MSDKLTIYAFSGLGTDEQIFQFLDLNANIEFVPWRIPHEKDDMASFALRLIEEIEPKKPYAFLGVSFGGMLVNELHHILDPRFTISVSSIKCKKEMPAWLNGLSYNPFVWMMPDTFFKPPFNVVKHAVGLSNPKHQEYFRGFYEKTSGTFFKRSVKIITQWKRKEVTKDNFIQIHGTRDKLFPLENMIEPNYTLDGSHFLIISGARGISRIINQEIEKHK